MIYIILGLLFWPLALYLNNTPTDFFSYIFPFFQVKLVAFPFIFLFFYSLVNKKITKRIVILEGAFLIVLLLNFKSFWGQTIFEPDYQMQQKIVRQTTLYPSVFSARLFQNKARIYIDKFSSNFFALTDPGNYFFKFAPRQIMVDNQNIKKFPSLAIFPVLIGFYYLNKSKQRKIILTLLFSSILCLSILTVFDRNDIILWLPLAMVFMHGAAQINKKWPRKAGLFWLVFVLTSLLELVQMIAGR